MYALFLDRDGVINVDNHYLCKIENLKFTPRAIEALSLASNSLASDKCKIIILTNQSGVARGFFTEDECKQFGKQFVEAVINQSNGKARIDDYLFCPHHPTEGNPPYCIDCACRKPKPGLLIQAKNLHDIDLSESFMIGDQCRDILAGQAVECFTFLIQTENSKNSDAKLSTPNAYSIDLYDAVTKVIRKVEERIKHSKKS